MPAQEARARVDVDVDLEESADHFAGMAFAGKDFSGRAWEGQIVDGKFRLIEFLGGSEHSAVFLTERAEHESAVIKLLALPSVHGAAFKGEQLAQWSEAAKMVHPHLVRLFEMGHAELEGGEFLYLVMERAEQDLSQVLPQRSLTAEETREMLDPTLQALAYLHGKELAHGGIKPSNIMSLDSQLKLASDCISLSPSRAAASLHGPPSPKLNAYAAPEGKASPQADIWSLGVTLVEALTQQAETKGTIQPGDLAAPFGEIVRRCLLRDPQRRATAAEIMQLLQSAPPAGNAVQNVVQKPAELAPQSSGPSMVRAQAASAHRRALASILVPVLGGAVLLTFVLYTVKRFRPSPRPQPSAAVASMARPQTETPPKVESGGALADGSVARRVLPVPSSSALATIQGTVKVSVEVDVDSSGRVVDARFDKRGPSKYFARQAMDAARQWEFAPRKLNGASVPSTWLLHFEFKRAGAGASATERPA
ncbi:MAG: TonB family protein [Acidobacteriaceae bacterium]